MGRFTGKTVVEHRREFIEHLQYGKQIGKILDNKNMQKRPRAPKPIFLGLESEKNEKSYYKFGNFEKYKNCSQHFCA